MEVALPADLRQQVEQEPASSGSMRCVESVRLSMKPASMSETGRT